MATDSLTRLNSQNIRSQICRRSLKKLTLSEAAARRCSSKKERFKSLKYSHKQHSQIRAAFLIEHLRWLLIHCQSDLVPVKCTSLFLLYKTSTHVRICWLYKRVTEQYLNSRRYILRPSFYKWKCWELPKVFRCFQGDVMRTLGRKGLIIITANRLIRNLLRRGGLSRP